MKRNVYFRLLFLLFLVAVTAVSTRRTYAHASVVGSDPADNSILDEAPKEVRIWFTEPVAVDFSTFRVLDINGQPVELKSIQRDEADHKIITLVLPELSSGVYSIHWNVLSEADGHDTKGVIAFGIGSTADLSAAHVGDTETAVPWGEVTLRWLNYSLLALITGAIAIYYLVLGRSSTDPEIGPVIQDAQANVIMWAKRAVIAAFILGFFLLGYQIYTLLQSLPDTATFWGTGWKLLTLSRWGYLWITRQIILPVILVFLLLIASSKQASNRHLAGVMAAIFMVGLLVVQSLNSHAAAVSKQTELAIAMDALHLVGIGLWFGGLLALILGLFPYLRRNRQQFTALVRAGWGKYSLLAVFSVLLIVFTGIYSTGRYVATLDALISTFYGQMLMGKVGLMLLMGAVGLLNAMLLHPKAAAPLARLLRQPQGWTPLSLTRLPQLVLVEVGLGVLVIMAVGLVTATATAQGPEFIPFDRDVLLDSLTASVDDMLVSFSAKPNTPGQNVFLIRAASVRRPAPAEVMRVIARLTYLDEDIGTTTVDAQEISDGEYHIGGSYFSLPGSWQVEVVVRRRGIEDTVAQYVWVVPPAIEARPVIVSNQPWEPILTWAGLLGLSLLVAIFAGYLIHRRRTAVSRASAPPQPVHNFVTAHAITKWHSIYTPADPAQANNGEDNE
ncbi:MAG: copper resistance protein CopC/CopD [Anaerolineae bacterium]|nr:copper resistance protein CopC/CopD [Anaerolineae bacterium]